MSYLIRMEPYCIFLNHHFGQQFYKTYILLHVLFVEYSWRFTFCAVDAYFSLIFYIFLYLFFTEIPDKA